MPDRIRAALRRTRRRTGSGRTVGVGVGIVVAVLITAVAGSMLLAPGAETAAPAGGGAALDVPFPLPETPSPSADGPSPSKKPSKKPTSKPTKPSGETEPAEKPADKAASGPKFPGGGSFDIRPAHTGLCLGIGPEIGNEGRTVLVQDSCSQAAPSLTTVKLGEDLVRFTLYFAAEDWSACIGADSPGELYAARDCDGGALQTFKLVPAGSGRYLIKSTANGTCMDFPWDRGTEGAQVGGASCSADSSSQRFAFS